MSKRRTGDLKLIQELNRSIILDCIRKEGPISRSDIAKRHHISPTTVTSAINELIKLGFVCEGKQGASSGGRKPILVEFSPNNRFIIGVSITNSAITIGELNLEPKVVRKHSFPVGERRGEALIQYLLHLLEEFIQEYTNLDSCLGVSILTPGIADYESGVIKYNSKLMLINVPLKELVETKFGLKTWLDNDTNAIALAEIELGGYKNSQNLLYVMIGDGVGSGIVLNGSIFRGSQGGAGELGHTTVERGGVRCECGNRGCLENYISWPALYSRILSSVNRKESTRIVELANGDVNKITPANLYLAALEGDRLASDILEDTASYLSTGIVNAINLFNPDLVILGGDVVDKSNLLVSKINERITKNGLKILTNDLKVYPSTLGEGFELIAAGTIVLHELFHFSLSS